MQKTPGMALLLILALVAAPNLTVTAAQTPEAASVAAAPNGKPCPSECDCRPDMRVMCMRASRAFGEYVKDLPVGTQQISVACQPLLTSDGRPIPDGSALQELRPDAFRHLLDIREILIRNCPIKEIPDELFAYLPLLETVQLEKLAFSTLPSRLFFGSGRLRELLVLQTPDYTQQTSRPLLGTTVENLRLIDVGLPGVDLLNLIGPVAGRIRLLQISSGSSRELRLPPGAFNDTSDLNELVLSNNGIKDFSFLDGISAMKVTLSYNLVGNSGELSLPRIRPNWRPKVLVLSHMGLLRVPDGLGAFPALEELVLSNNAITEVPAKLLLPLEKLTRLDLSSNRIRTLSSELQPELSKILYRDRSNGLVYLAGNPLHCNCELTWIFDRPVLHNKLPKDVICESGGQFAGEDLIRVQRHQLRCIPPSQPTIEVHIVGVESTGANIRALRGEDTVPEYRLPVGSSADLVCTSAGDPAPELIWNWEGSVLRRVSSAGATAASAADASDAAAGIFESRLSLHVPEALMRARRMLLTCSAVGHPELPGGSYANSTIALVRDPSLPPTESGAGRQLATSGSSSKSADRSLFLWLLWLLVVTATRSQLMTTGDSG